MYTMVVGNGYVITHVGGNFNKGCISNSTVAASVTKRAASRRWSQINAAPKKTVATKAAQNDKNKRTCSLKE